VYRLKDRGIPRHYRIARSTRGRLIGTYKRVGRQSWPTGQNGKLYGFLAVPQLSLGGIEHLALSFVCFAPGFVARHCLVVLVGRHRVNIDCGKGRLADLRKPMRGGRMTHSRAVNECLIETYWRARVMLKSQTSNDRYSRSSCFKCQGLPQSRQ